MLDAHSKNGRWVKDAQVYINGDQKVQAERTSWQQVAVLEVSPGNVPFLIGWRTGQFDAAEFYSEAIRPLQKRFGMKIGDEGVWFVARPIDSRTPLVIELIDIVRMDDSNYSNLPLY